MDELKSSSEIIKKMASLAWEAKIKGKTFERNSLLQPINLIFDQIRKPSQVLDTETIKASTAQKIFDYLERISDFEIGKTKHQKVSDFTELFFTDLLNKVYKNRLPLLISDEKNLKAAYLFYLRNTMSKEKGENQ